MIGRQLRAPGELLLQNRRDEIRGLQEYDERMIRNAQTSVEVARVATEREQERQAKFCHRGVRTKNTWKPGSIVCVFRPPQGRKTTKLGHRWHGPALVVESAGYDNWLVEMTETRTRSIVHSSFLVSYYYPPPEHSGPRSGHSSRTVGSLSSSEDDQQKGSATNGSGGVESGAATIQE